MRLRVLLQFVAIIVIMGVHLVASGYDGPTLTYVERRP